MMYMCMRMCMCVCMYVCVCKVGLSNCVVSRCVGIFPALLSSRA